jgi:hypothetical protein
VAAGSKGGLIVSGLLGIGLAIGLALIPQSENYTSIYGYNSVEVTCGTLSHREVKVNGSLLGVGYNGSDVGSSDLYGARIFEGKSADEVCDGDLKTIKTWVIVSAIAGGLMLLIGLFSPSSKPAFRPTYNTAHGAGSPTTNVARPATSTAKVKYRPDPNPCWASASSGSTSAAVPPLPGVGSGGGPVPLPTPPRRQTTSGPVPFASPAAQASVPAPAVTPPSNNPGTGAGVPFLPISYPTSLSVPLSSAPQSASTSPVAPVQALGFQAPLAPAQVPPLPTPPPPGPPQFAVTSFDDTRTQYRQSSVPQSQIIIAFGNGDRVELLSTVAVGRNPDAMPGGTVHRLNDPLLSKTHLIVGRTANDIWIEDRGSVNGTEIHSPRGESFDANSGSRITLSTDASVSFGDSSLTIERGI